MGVDINSAIKTGETPLIQSLQTPHEGGNIPLKFLLDHGADHRLKTGSGRTILHQAGDDGNLESIRILRNAHLSDIDIHAKLYDTGATAMDLVLSPYREFPASEELIESFKVLLAEIEARTNGQTPYGDRAGDHVDEVVDEDVEVENRELPNSSLSTPKVSITPSEDSENELEFHESFEFQTPGSI